MEELLKDFIPYDRALRLKAIGFDEPCLAFYNGEHLDLGVWDWEYPAGEKRRNIGQCPSAPTFSAAFRWFREKHELYSWVQLHNGYIDDSFYKKLPITWTIMEHESGKQYYERDIDHNYLYHTHEEAELACLDKLLEIVESKSE